MKPASRTLLASMISAAIAGTTFGVAYAQDDEAGSQGPEPTQVTGDEITVTGSRIRRDDFSSAQPTTVLDSEYLQNLGIINLGQAMSGVPQNVNRNSPDANAGNNFFNGSTYANLRGLNPFFGTRTLTLVDSRRHVPTNQGDGVDLNFIPTILIDRVETVTGGASASYGSGAIGGVQNILLDRDYEGIKAEVDFGATSEGDGDSTHYGFAFGTAIGESGNFVVGIEGEDSDAIVKCSTARDWCGTNTALINNWQATGPRQLIIPGIRETWTSRNSVFWLPGPGAVANLPPFLLPTTRTGGFNSGSIVPGVELNAAGNGLTDFDPGMGGDGFFQGTALGGEGEGAFEDVVLRSPVERQTAYASFTRDINERLGFFVEASLGNAETDTEGGFTNIQYTCIRRDNAYVQQNPALLAFVDSMLAASLNVGAFPCLATGPVPGFPGGIPAGVPLVKNWENQIDHGNNTDTDLTRYAFGFDGEFGDSSWTWDAYYQWGESDRTQLVRDLVHANRYNYAMDTVLNAQGQPVCRSVADPAVTTPVAVSNVTNQLGYLVADPSLRTGCQPLNPFGTNPIPAAAKAYAFGYIREDTKVQQDMVEFVASGDLSQGIGDAGPIRAAAGVSWREESLENRAAEELDPAVRKDFAIQYGESFDGVVEVMEYFAELDVPFHQTFSMNVAARRSEYENTAGRGTPNPGEVYKYDIDTWKVGAQWDVVPSFRVRLSESHDIRAPNHRELYYGQVFTPGSFFGFIQPPFSTNRWTNTTSPDPVGAVLYGGARNGILPEEADTTTVGFVIQPPSSSIRLALDYFKINLVNSIAPANLDITLQGCYTGIASYCDQITSGTRTQWQNPALDHNGAPTPPYVQPVPPPPAPPVSLGPRNSIPCPVGNGTTIPYGCFTDIESYYSQTYNAGDYDVEGLDITFDWIKTLDNGSFALRFLGTRTFSQLVNIVRNPLGQPPPTDIAGTVGSTVAFLSDYASAADFAGNVIATWSRGNFSLTGQMRYIDDGVIDRTRQGPEDVGFNPAAPTSVNVNTIDSYEVYSLSGNYNFALSGGNQMQLWGAINNLTDEDPPATGGGVGFASGIGGTNPIFYDTAGLSYRVGLRMNF
jgi:outer membrane receptor protein involved in Fe transport